MTLSYRQWHTRPALLEGVCVEYVPTATNYSLYVAALRSLPDIAQHGRQSQDVQDTLT